MALLFMDGFDHYTTLSEKWNGAGANCSISAANGRNGDGMRSNGGLNTTNGHIRKSIPSVDTVVFGFALKWVSVPAVGGNKLIEITESSTIHLDFILSDSGVITVRRGGLTTLGNTSQGISQNIWTYVEVKVVISDTVGEVTIKLDGTTTVLNLTNQDTRNGVTGVINQLSFGMTASGGDVYLDDLYICDTTGTLNNDFLGDVKVTTLYPNGNGNYSQWAGSDGNSVDNYLLVDEADANTSDYIQSSTVNQKDTFTYQDVGVGATIKGVQICSYVKKSDAGNREVRHVTRVSATDYNSTAQSLGSSYKIIRDIRETDPSTAVAWTEAGINGAEFGIELTL